MTADAVRMGLDERFIHYASDVDLQRRAKREHGALSLWVPSVFVEHGLHPPHMEWWQHDQRLLAEAWQ
jgi:GT2 family glycosyltransferase